VQKGSVEGWILAPSILTHQQANQKQRANPLILIDD
jgi:hypothetical protein